MKGGKSSFDRRTVLKSIGAGAALLSGAGIGSAREQSPIDLDTKAKLMDQYEADSLSNTIVEEYVQAEVDFLAEEGIVEDATLDRLPTDNHIEEREALNVEEDREGFAVTAVKTEGEATAHIAVKFTEGEHDIAVYSQPERDNSYAIVEDGSGEKTVFEASSGRIMDQECNTSYSCGEECNMYHQNYSIETVCCYSDISYDCYTESKTCPC